MLVQTLIHGSQVDGNIRVGSLKGLDTFRRPNNPHEFYFMNTPALEDIDCGHG